MSPSDRPLVADLEQLQPRPAAVLILLYPDSHNTHGGWSFPLIQRGHYPGVHSDQVGLPGGRLETGESAEQAALRETCEEIGVCADIAIIGTLNPLYVPPSNHLIMPFIGLYTARPIWQPDTREVAGIMEVQLSQLFNPGLKRTDTYTTPTGRTFERPHYWLNETIVWGATAIMLSEFEQRLRRVGFPD